MEEHNQRLRGGRNSRRVQGPLPASPAGCGGGSWPELSGVGPVSVGVGKHRALKGESLCICPCCLMQNVSKPVSRMLHTCPIQCLMLRPSVEAPPPPPLPHCPAPLPAVTLMTHPPILTCKAGSLPRVPGGAGGGGRESSSLSS